MTEGSPFAPVRNSTTELSIPLNFLSPTLKYSNTLSQGHSYRGVLGPPSSSRLNMLQWIREFHTCFVPGKLSKTCNIDNIVKRLVGFGS